jgi:tRNA/tmRNA/rRNA uracil-C5-methylase (TrmA/RlmC/RlmD family)
MADWPLQASDGIAEGLLDASEDLAWVSVAAAQEQASWRLRQTVSRSDFDRCLPAAAVDAQQISEVQESDDGEAQARGIELLELYCGNGNHTVAMSGVFNR